MSIGDTQYQWFKNTLEQSRARYKFVFAHHVLGTGRGGIERADLYEWGGRSTNGTWEFGERRPGWELPIHPLMVKHETSEHKNGEIAFSYTVKPTAPADVQRSQPVEK